MPLRLEPPISATLDKLWLSRASKCRSAGWSATVSNSKALAFSTWKEKWRSERADASGCRGVAVSVIALLIRPTPRTENSWLHRVHKGLSSRGSSFLRDPQKGRQSGMNWRFSSYFSDDNDLLAEKSGFEHVIHVILCQQVTCLRGFTGQPVSHLAGESRANQQ